MPDRSHYHVNRQVGCGAFGLVEEVEGPGPFGPTVALKRPTAEALQSDRDRRRFQREAQLLQRLDHPNIVKILDQCLTGEDIWFTMPLATSSIAREVIGGLGMPDDEIKVAFDQILDAIIHAHSRGVIHRDLNPHNVLIIDGRIVVADFGLGRHILSSSDGLTVGGERIGTYGYVAPEQWTSLHEVDQRADIFALGSMLFFLATGENPLAHDPRKLVRRFGFIINRCREHDPDRRYSSVEELRADFERLWIVDVDPTPLAERGVNLTADASSDPTRLQELIDFYSRNAEDFQLFTETLPHWPESLWISVLDHSAEDLLALASAFDGHLSGHFAFEVVDGLVDCLLRIFRIATDQQLRRMVFARALQVGARHNRFYVGRRIAALVHGSNTASEILAIREVFFAYPKETEWVSQWVAPDRTSPVILDAIWNESKTNARRALPTGAMAAAKLPTGIKSEFKPGLQVRHDKFGHGYIVDIEPFGSDQIVAVNFDEFGRKRLLASLGRMSIIDLQQDEPPTNARSSSRELPYSEGQLVHHPKFGRGKVVETIPRLGDQELAVEFEAHGPKRLLASLAAMTIVSPSSR